ncbi:protein UXT homolog [Leptinotarsa decemlineata]|uniref:protein UXT homolog n=1 Tax=Leptinotarsa decemlineata TaxID=7539 RepID=UPI000C252130|nr:uncharacterized protein LOC111505554 [Leptinotarsa decemlineata]
MKIHKNLKKEKYNYQLGTSTCVSRDSAMHSADIQKKIEEYNNFIEVKLKNDLKDIEKLLDDKSVKLKDWQEVKQVLKTVREFREKDRDMSVRVDIGGGVLSTSEITDFERTYVSIGLGYMLEMDCDEADKYADIRLRLLTKEINHFRNLAVDVKVHIKLVLLAINELQASIKIKS